jgi:putative sigma-54 modulation protein
MAALSERPHRVEWVVFPPTARISQRSQELAPVQINISVRHGHVSPATQERITEKVEAVRKFYDRLTSIQVIVDLGHRESPTVEINATAEHHDTFVSTVKSDSILTALDGAIDKLEQQLRKHKEKLKDHKASGHKHLEPPLDGEPS